MKTSFASRVALSAIVAVLGLSGLAPAAIISFNLLGKGGSGLIGGNQNTVVTNPGSGGETGQGVYLDTSDNRLYVLLGWGSLKGFTDLTGPAIAQHIHGPTLDGGAASFTEDAPVLFGLDPLNFIVTSSATNGGINGSATLTAPQVADLLAGRYYINVHTTANPNGEIRGNISLIPEPCTTLLALMASGATLVRRRLRN